MDWKRIVFVSRGKIRKSKCVYLHSIAVNPLKSPLGPSVLHSSFNTIVGPVALPLDYCKVSVKIKIQ